MIQHARVERLAFGEESQQQGGGERHDPDRRRVDAIVERMAAAARANARRLAELAVEETGYGNAKDKYIKNILNCDWLPRKMRGMKTNRRVSAISCPLVCGTTAGTRSTARAG